MREMRLRFVFFLISFTLLFVLLSLLSSLQAAQIEFVWSPPQFNTDGTPLTNLAGYKLYYGRSSRNYEFVIDVGNRTSYTLSGLEPEQTYYFALTAYNTSGHESEFSPELVYTFPPLDTDGDGLPDREEELYETSPTLADTDGDGVDDGEEVNLYGTNPCLADTDGDGMDDGGEIAWWGEEWKGDADGDGVINLLDADADDDGFPDGIEVEQGADPANFLSLPFPPLIPQEEMQVVWVDSEELVAEDGAAENAIDGDPTTIWHTEWAQADPPPPHELLLDLGAYYWVEGFRYLPRQTGSLNGTVTAYQLYVSADGVDWGEPVAGGALAPDRREKEVRFAGKAGRFVRFVALEEIHGNPWTSLAEFNVLIAPGYTPPQ
ncbi:MAG: hypothetical protein D6736_13990 [Nitrospinota bacterium]|nr:MAG: hypothetical protein D6736_13990 [Nitrospinota bacterium]